jgi:hypothetical protein
MGQSLEGSVKRGSLTAGAGRQCAPAAPIGRLRAAPQLHRQVAAVGRREVHERCLSLNAWW